MVRRKLQKFDVRAFLSENGLGRTRARVSFFVNRFRKLGLIDYNGDLEVRSILLDVVQHD
jgi:hypothetical protein